jgi:hypothetical protein
MHNHEESTCIIKPVEGNVNQHIRFVGLRKISTQSIVAYKMFQKDEDDFPSGLGLLSLQVKSPVDSPSGVAGNEETTAQGPQKRQE